MLFRAAWACLAAICCPSFLIGVTVSFKLGPQAALVRESTRLLALSPAENGARTADLPTGRHTFVIASPGYLTRTLRIDVAETTPLIEEKLEREASSLTLQRLVATQDRPKSVEFTPDGKYVVVAPLSGDSIEVFDAQTWSRAAELVVPAKYAHQQGFVESAFLRDRGELWVSQMYPSMIHIFRLKDFSWTASIPSGGEFPKVLAVHPDGKRVFVSNWLSGSISVIDAETRTAVAKVALRGIPRGLAVSQDGKWLYAANFETGTVDVVDLSDYTWKKSLLQGGAKRHLVLDPRSNRLYISDMHEALISVMQLPQETVIAQVKVSNNPNTIKLSPSGDVLFVTTRGVNNPQNYEWKGPQFGELLMIDTTTFRIRDRQWGGNQPTGLAVSPDGQTVVFSDFLDHRLEVYRRELP